MSTSPATPALDLRDVRVVVDGTVLLHSITWAVRAGERWVVLGPNGAGKTTLLRVASLYLHPTSGDVTVDGRRLGRTDVRALRTRIGLSSPAFGDLLRPALTAVEVVMAARHAALETWWHQYDDADRTAARSLLDRFGVAHLADRAIGTLSSGERQRVLLARAFFGSPAVVLLDEPTAGLDLGAREDLVARLGRTVEADPPTVLVTHHVEEIPSNTTHVLLLRRGRVTAIGPVDDVLTAAALGATFDVPLSLEHRSGRWSAWAESP